jgi:Transglutaminase-like superfamily
MALLILKAFCELIRLEPYLMKGNFMALHQLVRRCAVLPRSTSPYGIDQVCSAVDFACACYWKQVLCLQRSVATTLLLRRNGQNAVLVLGAQDLPFRAHAWVEINGSVVNDKPYAAEMYTVLDRC